MGSSPTGRTILEGDFMQDKINKPIILDIPPIVEKTMSQRQKDLNDQIAKNLSEVYQKRYMGKKK